MYMQPSEDSRSDVVWCVNLVIVKLWVFSRDQGVIGNDVVQRCYPFYLNPTDVLFEPSITLYIHCLCLCESVCIDIES